MLFCAVIFFIVCIADIYTSSPQLGLFSYVFLPRHVMSNALCKELARVNLDVDESLVRRRLFVTFLAAAGVSLRWPDLSCCWVCAEYYAPGHFLVEL